MLTDALIEIFVKNWPMLLIFITIVASLRITYLLVQKKKFYLYKEILALAFIVYILSLFYAVTFQDVSWSSSNFVPFKEIFRYEFGSYRFIKNALGNLIIFMPYGFFVGYIISSIKYRYIIILSIITSVTIEVTQLAIGRVFDIDDIILNVLGGILGFTVYIILEKIKDKLPVMFQKELFYNIITLVVILLVALYFVTYIGIGV